MGHLPSKDTRRISFDNTFAMSTALAIPKQADDEVLTINTLETNKSNEFYYKEKTTPIEVYDNEHDYWVQRIEYLKNEHQLINKIVESEYEKTIEDTKNLFDPPKITHEKIQKIRPCYEWRSKMLKCYEDNPHQPLLCAATVQAFTSCVTACQMEEQ
ncbi:uncharacterized protein LOC125054468 [Pieris napi]|uniref:Uncharacterized protein n=1 Tax=Pieris macdunnoughi TaxID=345717 RepID=A0A821NVG3_9NEOP|nr:uncharacterized protein LOC125054468 [Pieris napi]CAF4791679.1 unnamed protein product [Pieris macdunnoughi]